MLQPVDPRVLMADGLVAAQPRKRLVHEIGAVVRPEALDAVTKVRQDFFGAEATSAAPLLLRG